MTAKTIVISDEAPQAIGPYSQAVEAGNMVFVSGQLPVDTATGELAGPGVAAQTAACLKNLEAVLKAAGLTLDSVVKTTVFMTELGQFQEMNQAYGAFFQKNPPARATVGVKALPKGASVEIEAIAVKDIRKSAELPA